MPDHVPDIELGECAEGIEVTPKGSCNITFKDGSTSKPQTDQRPDEEVANKPHPKDNTHGLWLLSNEIYSLVHLAVDSLVLLSLLLQLTVMAGKAVKYVVSWMQTTHGMEKDEWTFLTNLKIFVLNRLHTEKRHTLLLLILLTCIVNTIVAILVLYGQYLFIKVPQLRQLINMLRMEVNRMMDENNILCHNINNLEKEQHRLQDVEEKLQDIVQRQGGNVQQFRVLVQENASILHRQQVGGYMVHIFSVPSLLIP
jgi:FtsZ-binding cell division protein ZapB